MIRGLITAILLISRASFAHSIDTTLSERETKELTTRLHAFYEGKTMDLAPPKFDARSSREVTPNGDLRGNVSQSDPLLESAGKKVHPKFLEARQKSMNTGREPRVWEKPQAHDQFESLIASWVETPKIVRAISELPIKGRTRKEVWSGDYWRTRWGQTSYRYIEGKYFSSYREAIDDYLQPLDWQGIREKKPDEITSTTGKWSPSEKYDLLMGSEDFLLTDQQKQEGSSALGEDGDVEAWFGICHGWAPASFMVPVPKKKFTTLGPRGARIEWYPDDVRALATLAWANGRFLTNFMGGRCNNKETEKFPNGRLSQPECFDSNPVSFHLALANMLGKEGAPFIMDSAFDYQVWNQPILAYEVKYFDPINPDQMGTDWEKYAVAYDEKFKQEDRFQEPLTRGTRSNDGTYDDSRVRKIVGVVATVVYLAENRAAKEPLENSTVRVSYTYDLELERDGDDYFPSGGEWHENAYPDFLWVPQKDSVAIFYHDRERLNVDLEKAPEAKTKSVAEHAAGYGYPLCQLLAPLIRLSSGKDTYQCPF